MNVENFARLVQISNEPDIRERTIEYLTQYLSKFLKPGERVMLAFREHKEGNISFLMEQALLRLQAVPVIWEEDHRWNTLLRQSYRKYVTTVIGSPLIILGLTKLKRHSNTPLRIRKVITVGYPCLDWVHDGIVKGMDCEMGGCFSVDEEGIVAGFACGHSGGVHICEDIYGVDIVDDRGRQLMPGEMGEIVIWPRQDPGIRIRLGDLARINATKCGCGCDTVRLTDMQLGSNVDPDLYKLSQQLQSWTSILDCRVAKTASGLDMEIVCFPGEKLPDLPTAARLVIRPYDPRQDEPFWFTPDRWDRGIYVKKD